MAKGTKTGGRQEGTPNKTTAEMRDLLQSIFEHYESRQMKVDLLAVDAETRLRFMVEVAKLITPKPSTIQGFGHAEQPLFSEPITGMRILNIDPLDKDES